MMKPKTFFKIVIDFIMTASLPVLMAFMLTGQEAHEWLGAGMFVLLIVHNLLNLRWYGNLLKGKYTAFRIFQTAVNLLVFAAMIGLMVSGIMLSRYVFGFLSISDGLSFARTLHLLAAYWGFILMSLHAGLHWSMMMGMVRRATGILNPSKTRTIILRTVAALIAAYGVYAFVKHDIVSYLFLRKLFVFFDYDQSAIVFFADYLAMMGLWIFIAYYVARRMQKWPSRKSGARRSKQAE